jgi:endonuclease/exonuclease/phosphatase family metal-dependent hydrolase
MEYTTYNVAQLPKAYNSLPNRAFRIKRVCEYIVMNNPPPVLLLQELFSAEAQGIVVELLKSKYPYMYFDRRPGAYTVGVNSGLAILSAFPLNDVKLYEYVHKRNVDIFARKGLFSATVFGYRTTRVYTTHLQAGGNMIPFSWLNSDNADYVKAQQLEEACARITQETKDIPIVLFGGDFNLTSSEALLVLQKHFPQARETFSNKNGEFTTKDRDRPDHFFVLKAPDDWTFESYVKERSDYTASDHLPLQLNITS